MKTTAALAIALLAAAAAPRAAEEIAFRGEGGYELRGTYWAATAPGPCVLLLHQCNRDRTAYASLAPALAAAGMHVFAFDFRGFGESIGEGAGSFRERSEELWPLFAADVDAALAVLAARPGVDGARVGILGASCGGSQALLASSRHAGVRALAFLSSSLPWLVDAEIEAFETGRSIPLLCIAAEEDRGTYERTKRIFQSSTNPETRLLLYKGNAHGAALFDQDPSLVGTIVDWFGRRLR
ncbi:MAG: alpha/beta fold hydrolase [Candidatus Latescibacterota bacterium]|nr:MAG: alpha/beta fold hydrolase [Candidatus Latescibacterota bacterium]